MNPPDRSSWPVHVFPLGAAPGPDISGHTTAEERLAMMWNLAVEAWTLAGHFPPEYERSETPIRVVYLDSGQDAS